MLTVYKPEVVAHACDPRVGVASKYKFPPTISEVHDFCQDYSAHLATMAKYAAWTNQPERDGPPKNERLSLDELKAKYPPDWGLGDPDRRPINERLIDEGHKPAGVNPEPPLDVERHERSRQWLKDHARQRGVG